MADNLHVFDARTHRRVQLRTTVVDGVHTLHTIVESETPVVTQYYDNGGAFASLQEHQVAATAIAVKRLYGFKSTAVTEFLQVYDVAGAAAGIPLIQLAIPENSSFSIDLGADGRAFANGLTVALSTASGSLVAGSAGLWLNAEFV